MVLLLWIAIQLTPVQNWLVSIATKKLSKQLHTEVKIEQVNFSFFNKASLKKILIKDKQNDTLLYAGSLKISITDWFFLKQKAELKYIGLEDAKINIYRKDSIWNYQFLVTYFAAPQKKQSNQSIELNIKKIDLKNIYLIKNDEWRGEKISCKLVSLSADAQDINFNKNSFNLNSVDINQPDIRIYNFDGLRPAQLKKEMINDTGLQLNPSNLQLMVKKLNIINGVFIDDADNKLPTIHFDGAHIDVKKINANFLNIKLLKDTITANIKLACNERSGIEIKKLSANFKATPQIMEFANLELQTNKSKIGNYYAMKFKHFNKDFAAYITNVTMKANFIASNIYSDDIAYFAPELYNWKKNAAISGNFDGTVANFLVKNLLIQNNKTTISGNFTMKGLPNIDSTLIELNNGNINTNYKDLCSIAPSLKNVTNPNLAALGLINFKGTYNGYYHNFYIKGLINNALGAINTNLQFRFPKNADATYKGFISAKQFNLGNFLNENKLGNINFEGKIDGYSFNKNKIKTTYEGNIQELFFNGYSYKNIETNGTYLNQSFSGQLKIDDPNVNLTSAMQIDFSGNQPHINLFSDIINFNFKKTNFTNDNLQLAGTLDVNFTGNNIDNFLGNATLLNAVIKNNEAEAQFDSLSLASIIKNSKKYLSLAGNDFLIDISGNFNILGLPNSFQSFLHNYYPSYISAPTSVVKNQQFNFKLTTNYIEPYLQLLNKNISGFNNTTIEGEINTSENKLQVAVKVPYFKYQNYSFSGINIVGKGNSDSLTLSGAVASTQLNDSFYLPTSRLYINSANDHSVIRINTSANNTLNDAALMADVFTLEDGCRVQFKHSSFVINEKKWNIDSDGELIMRKSYVSAKKLKLTQGLQEINIATENEEDNNANNLIVQLNKVVLGDFTSLFFKDPKLEGITSGSIKLKDFFRDFEIESSLQVEQFRLDKDSIGLLNIDANFQQKTSLVNWNILSENKKYEFKNTGSFNIKDSAKQNPLSTNFNFINTNISVAEKYLSGIFSQLTGNGSGVLKITGNPNQLNFLGDIKIANAGLLVDYTQVFYHIDSATIHFEEDGINCGKITIKDKFNNQALVKGKLFEKGFKNMIFDFEVATNKLLLIDTKAKDNNQFYGNAIGKAYLSFKGPESNAKLTIVGEANDTSHIYLPSTSSKESGDADYIVFKQLGNEIEQQSTNSKFNLLVDLDLTANNKVAIDVILDEAEGDIIKATGNGRLKIKAGTNEKLDIRGRYNIENGLYDFNFQSIIKKPFVLMPQYTNYIEWSGDPYKADIHVDAQYEADNISLADLITNSTFGSANNNLKAQRGPVFVIAQLRDKLLQPTIKFKIDFPQNSPAKTDPSFKQFLARIEKDDNEMLTQATSLIVFGTFTPYGQGLIGGGAANTINYSTLGINTISQKITNEINKQVSNVLYKLFKDKSLKFELGSSVYNSSNLFNQNLSVTNNNKFDRTRVNFKVDKSFFNNKLLVTLGGGLDFNVGNAAAQTNNLQWLPDVNIEYVFSQNNNSKLLGIVFSKNSLDINGFSLGSRNRKGLSISYRRESEHFPIFGKKEDAE